ncbi:MAG: DMT family transporter [Chloroflexota bacterium]
MQKSSPFNLLLLLPGTIWGISFVVVELALEIIQPISMTLLRSVISVGFLYLGMRYFGGYLPRSWREWSPFIGIAAFNQAMPFALTAWGQTYIDGGLASILLSTNPLFTLLLAAIIFSDEHFTAPKVIGVVFGLVGIVTLIGREALSGLGVNIVAQLAVVASALMYGIGAVLLRRLIPRQPKDLSPWGSRLRVITAQFMAAIVMLTPFAFWLEEPLGIQPTFAFWMYMLFLGVGVTLFATMVYFYLIEKLGASTASTTVYLIPISGVLMGVLILNETLTRNMVIALLLILLGIYLSNRSPRARTDA